MPCKAVKFKILKSTLSDSSLKCFWWVYYTTSRHSFSFDKKQDANVASGTWKPGWRTDWGSDCHTPLILLLWCVVNSLLPNHQKLQWSFYVRFLVFCHLCERKTVFPLGFVILAVHHGRQLFACVPFLFRVQLDIKKFFWNGDDGSLPSQTANLSPCPTCFSAQCIHTCMHLFRLAST